ncbi:S41 family peptidase [uncultured Pontibacter sp.]|uniref:S41 family peptidase n=1 Tax=uncultured Pontibacter sp. TaxID=453356 RepID=UPI002622156E|nr:S41 family peptidase [uncultured Pontibacter sp.]
MKKKLKFTFAILFTALQAVVAQQQELKFAAADVKADVAYLYKTLENAHYNLFAYVSKNKYDKAYAAIQKSIGTDSLSLLETTKLFQKFTAVGNVGHCEVDFPAQPYIAYAQNGGTVFPLELAFENNHAYVRKNYAANANITVGDQVISIDKTPIKSIQEAIHPFLSAERTYFKNAKLEFWSFPRLYWSVLGAKETFAVKVKTKEGKQATYTLQAIPVMDYETKRGGEILNNARVFKHINAVAYINPGPFSSSEADGEERFKAFVDAAFTDINTKNTQNLVVDLRNNSGGHNAYSDYLISYFADKPFRWFSKFELKTSEVLKEHTKKNATEMDAYTTAILNHENGEVFAYDQPIQNPVAEAKRFKGKVYVLVNRQTYSMAAVSAALVQDYGFATIVGEETGDVPTLYASQFSFNLPKTGIMVKVPKGYIVRPNGNEKLAGVVPDHVVKDHLLDEEDEILNYTLQTLLNSATQKP